MSSPCVEVADVVQRAAGDDRVEAPSSSSRSSSFDAPEELARRRERVDPEHVVARDGERGRQLALAAADVEHAGRRRRQVFSGELEEREMGARWWRLR